MINKKVKLENDKDNKLSIAVQALDNQYVPESILERMKILNLSKSSWYINWLLQNRTRREFKRALLYSEEIDVNRAFFVNNPFLYKKFSRKSKQRDAIYYLLKDKAFVPWLWKEHSIEEYIEKSIKGIDKEGKKALKEFIKDFGLIECVRLSNDEKENSEKANKMSEQLANYFKNSSEIVNKVVTDLKIEDKEGFKKKTLEIKKDIENEIKKNGSISRTFLYENYICVPGTEIDKGVYDFSKPFMREIKYLADLKYSSNFGDALDIQTFSPRELPSRFALHELDLDLKSKKEGYSFDLCTYLEEALHLFLLPDSWVKSLNCLTYNDILKIRKSEEYHNFIESIKSIQMPEKTLVKTGKTEQLNFRDFQEKFMTYQKLIVRLSSIRRINTIKPIVRLVIDIGINTIDIGIDQGTVQIVDDIIDKANYKDEIATIIIRAIICSESNNDLECSFNLLSSHIQDAESEFAHAKEILKKEGFTINNKPLTREVVNEEGTIATQEYPDIYK